jgi:hypothetical protein
MQDLLPNKNAPRKSERKKIRRKRKRLRGNSPEVSKRAAERHSFAVYSGQNWLGSVEQRGDAFTAKTIKGKKIGIFQELRKLLGIGVVTGAGGDGEVVRLSDAELIAQLSNQARELGIEIDLSYRLGGER